MGITIPQQVLFYSHTLTAAMVVEVKKDIPALMVYQARTTSTTCIFWRPQTSKSEDIRQDMP